MDWDTVVVDDSSWIVTQTGNKIKCTHDCGKWQGWRNDSRGGGNQALGALEEKGPQVYQRAQNHLYKYYSC